jgi:hypothetical protein
MFIKEMFYELHPDHLADLRRSGLSDKTILKAGIKSLPPNEITKKLGFNNPDITSCYEIPYDKDFSRFRIFYTNNATDKPKYLQRKGTSNRLYIHHLTKEILNNPSIPLYITEGEKKALKATQESLFCVALSGLWSWSNGKKELIEDFDQIVLKDRDIYIVPDNDWCQLNKHGYAKNLEQAVYELADRLKEKGAKVFIVQLPQGKLKGLDDYLHQHPIERLKALPAIEVKSLHEKIVEATPGNYRPLIQKIAEVDDEIEKDILCKALAKRLKVS